MKIRSFRAASPSAALFGKLPSALDFVRVNHDSAESIALDRWLQAALQRLTARNRPWPAGQLTFTFALDTEHSLVGVAADSCDRAGRRFPVAVYARVPRLTLVPWGSAALVLASEPFVAAARALLAEAAELSSAQVSLRLRRLRAPLPGELQAAAEQLTSEVATRRLGAFAARLFAAAPAPPSRARAAFEQLQGRRSRAGNAIECFDCPVENARDVAIWTYWLERAQGRPSAALWNLPGHTRALLAPGPLPERAPLFWGTPGLSHPALCRIGDDTRDRVALAAAVDGDAEQSLCAVFEQLATGPARPFETTR
jgi:type VI secretion system ImpM family protein